MTRRGEPDLQYIINEKRGACIPQPPYNPAERLLGYL